MQCERALLLIIIRYSDSGRAMPRGGLAGVLISIKQQRVPLRRNMRKWRLISLVAAV